MRGECLFSGLVRVPFLSVGVSENNSNVQTFSVAALLYFLAFRSVVIPWIHSEYNHYTPWHGQNPYG